MLVDARAVLGTDEALFGRARHAACYMVDSNRYWRITVTKRLFVATCALFALALAACDINAWLAAMGGQRTCPDPSSKGTMKAKLGSDAFEACIVTVVASPNGGAVIHGLSGDAVPDEILITVTTAAVGDVTLADGDNSGVIIKSDEVIADGEDAGSYTTTTASTGTVTFTTADGVKAVGSFAFTGLRKSDGTTPLAVTEGTFDVSY